MNTMADRRTCPFCSFSVAADDDNDMYFLMQHLELYHPEDGRSPFIATEDDSDLYLSTRSPRESTISADTPSEDNQEDYVECPVSCGETVTYAELESHIELHATEEIVLDDKEDYATVEDPLPIQGGTTLETDHRVAVLPSTLLPDSAMNTKIKVSRKHRHTHNTHSRRKDHHGIKDWKDLLLGSSSKKTRSNDAVAKHTIPRRLGVRIITSLCYH